MSVAGPNDIGFFLSGGSSNSNPYLSTGGAISNTRLTTKTFNNLWTNISERQVRYGFKDIRIIYLKNMHSQLTFKNMRVYWNESDNFTTMQIGRSDVNGVENSTVSLAALAVNDESIPPSMWNSVIAVDAFRIVQDFNDTAPNIGHGFGGQNVNGIKKGVHVIDSSAAIFNQKIARFSTVLRRTGDPRGPVNCKIWDSITGAEKASLGSIDSADIVVSSGASGPRTTAVFTSQNNSYAMQVGDIIGLEYPEAGQDEGEGDPDDHITWECWDWSGDEPTSPPEHVEKDIIGTDEYYLLEGASWKVAVQGMSELKYRAEIFGPEAPGGGEPCEPDPGDGDPGDPGNPPPPSGFIIMQDFTDLSAQTGYQVGSGAPNNIFRQAASIDGSNSPLLFAPVARITFLLRRVGNPQGTVSCRIWSNNGVVMQTLGQIQASSLTNASGQWSQSAFTLQDNTYNMKVGDLIGIEFTTGSNVDHILVAGWTWASTAAVAAEAETFEITAASDKYGVRYIYPNTGGFHYEDQWEIPSDSSSMRWDYSNPPLNAEMTCYFLKSSPSSDTISCKIRGGKHTDSDQDAGCCYILQFPCTGGTMEFQIECPHPDNHDCSTSGIDGTALSMSAWHGYKVAWWNVGNPPTTVHMEAWQDKGNNSGGTPTNEWEKLQVHDDSTGSCGNIDDPLFRPKSSSSQCTFRIDENSGTDYKWLSIVEIQPGGEVPPDGGGPGPPGAKDIPGTSIKRWNGSVWSINDGSMSDLVFKAERYAVLPTDPDNPPAEDPIIIDPGTRRKPTSYDQGIVFPPLEPGQYKALILERLVPPDIDEIGQEDIEQQIVAEIDATTEQEQPQDPGNPPPTQPPPTQPPPPTEPPPTQPPPSGQLGPYAGTGEQLSASTRRATRHYASGKPDDETVEKNTDNISYDHYQCIYYVTMHGIEHDDTVSVKYGGTHMGTGWFDHSISFEDGQSCMGYEEDHPNTNSCVIEGPSYGSILEKRIGICGVYRKQANLCELWINPGTGWVKALSSNDIDGFNPGNDGDDEAQLRIDGFEDGDDPTIDTAIVQEIAPA